MISKHNYLPTFAKLQKVDTLSFLLLLNCLFIFSQSPVFAQKASPEEAKIMAQQRLTFYQSLPDTLAEYRFVDREKNIQVTPAHESFSYNPPQYESVEHSELIKEGYEGFQQPIYKNIRKNVTIKDKTVRIEVIKPTFETYTENIEVTPKQSFLVKNKNFEGEPTSECINPETGLDECFWTKTDLPAVLKSVTKKRILQPAKLREAEIPMESRAINKKIIDWEATKKQPKGKKRIKIAPEYKTVNKQVLVRYPTAPLIQVPAEIVTINTQVWHDTNNDYYKVFDSKIKALNKYKGTGDEMAVLRYMPKGYSDEVTSAPPPPPVPAATWSATRAAARSAAPRPAAPPVGFASPSALPSPTYASSAPPKTRVNESPYKEFSNSGTEKERKRNHLSSYEMEVKKLKAASSERLKKASVTPDEIFSIVEEPRKEISFMADGVVEAEEAILETDRKDKPDNEIKANVLTAGEVNDFSKWELWQDIAAKDLAEWQEKWQFSPTERYTIQLVTEDGQPLVDTDVQLRSAESEVVWMAKTDNTGKAELWANLFVTDDFEGENNNTSKEANAPTSPPKVLKKDLSVLALVDGKLKEVAQASKFQEGLNILTVDAPCSLPQTVDIAMVVDATGSMGDEIEYLKVELNDVIGKVQKDNDNLTVNLGSVFYRDKGDAYITKKSDLSQDISQTVDFIKKQSAAGGGDFPEAVDAALSTAIYELEWSEKAVARLLFLVLDAPPHDNPKVVNRLAQLARDAANRGIRIIPVTASGIDKSTEYLMRSLALATNGTYTFLTDDSGVGNAHIAPTTDDFEVETLNDLMVRLIRQYTQVPECSKRKRRKNARKAKKELKDKLENIVRFYPNPTKGMLNIESQKNTIEELFISDATGKIIERLTNFSGKATIDLSTYPSGYYLIRYPNNADSNRWLTEKIILIR